VLFVLRPFFFSKSAQCDTIDKPTALSFSPSCISKFSILPLYNKNGSAIKLLESFKNPLNISTLSLTTFSFNTVEINVWSAPDKLILTLDLVISVSSVWFDIASIKSLAAYVTDEPETDDVRSNEQSVILQEYQTQ